MKANSSLKKTLAGLCMMLVCGSLFYQNCSRINYKVKVNDLNVAAGIPEADRQTPPEDTRNPAANCRSDAGIIGSRTIEISGPSTLLPKAPGSFQLIGIDSCESMKFYQWTAGDGSEPEAGNRQYSHSYGLPGIYRVRADITDQSNQTTRALHPVAVPGTRLMVSGPEMGRVGQDLEFVLQLPAGYQIQSATWNFQDSTDIGKDQPSQRHSFTNPGVYLISVEVTDIDNKKSELKHQVTVLAESSIPSCKIEAAGISSPTEAQVRKPVPFSVVLPPCLAKQIDSISWDFGDNGKEGGQFDVLHAFQSPGLYPVKISLWNEKDPDRSLLTFIRYIHILDDGGTKQDLTCPKEGQTMTSMSAAYDKEATCDLDGSKKQTYKDLIVQTCKPKESSLIWEETSRTPQLISEGACLKRSCLLPDFAQEQADLKDSDFKEINGKKYLLDGKSKDFFSTMTPKGLCKEVSMQRTCQNGELSNLSGPCSNCGKDSRVAFYLHLKCTDGCADVSAGNKTRMSLTSGQSTPAFFGNTYKDSVACENNGSKENEYHDQVRNICESGKVTLVKDKERILVSSGACRNQSCRIGERTLRPGESITLYSTGSPAGNCSSVAQTRICNGETGMLSGNSQFSQFTCSNGCEGFGPNGTLKSGIISGEMSEAKSCPFNEPGITSIFSRLIDQKCEEGSLKELNPRKGPIKSEGACPVYEWKGTDGFSACSADCGGEQTRIFECRDKSSGQKVDAARCAGKAAPVEKRVCDGNPNLTKTSESVSQEEVGSCTACPQNQIGIVIGKRDVVTVKTLSCVKNAYQETKSEQILKPWTYETYCRDFTTVRCGHDSLSNSEAAGRYSWMVKCQDKLPIIKEFLEKFKDVNFTGKDAWNINQSNTSLISTRRLYPTFFNPETKQPWIAPKVSTASCEGVPKNAYVAAVCVSSCASPEQQILASNSFESQGKPVSFIEAYLKKINYVSILGEDRRLKLMKVDMWVTELIDSQHQMLDIQTRSGGRLKVTLNHPMLRADRVMVEAADLKVGDLLMRTNGQQDPITDIKPFVHTGKVYNVFVKDGTPENNLVSTQGFINGTGFFQNEGAQYINREVLRDRLTEKLNKAGGL